jgi:acetylornithine/succinyldiaminopimelate/putrescine aminotransferase
MRTAIENSEKYIIKYGHFSIIIDKYDKSGKKYLDFSAGVTANSLGYGNKKILKVIERQSKNVRDVGEYFIKKYSIGEIRGVGLMMGIGLNVPFMPIISRCARHGLLLGGANENTLGILYPLTINKSQVDEAINVFKKVL